MTGTSTAPGVRNFAAPKVPAVFAMFWIVKLLTTGIGESGADYMAKVSLPLTALVGVGGFALAMRLQLRAVAYHPVRYWITVLMVAVFGTMVADAPHIVLGTPYWFNALGYFVTLCLLFGWWHRSEGTLSVHSITTSRRERFYWGAVLLTFGLGTALGDTTAANFGLGYGWSVPVFGVLILIPLALWRAGILDGTVAFWSSYVITRPLGASVADWLGKAKHGGLGWGDGPVTGVGLLLFAGLVVYLSRTHSDVDSAAELDALGVDEGA